MMKQAIGFYLLILSIGMESCAQNKPDEHLNLVLNKQTAASNFDLPQPDFIVNSYAFYPKNKQIAYIKNDVNAMSSSGYGKLYYDVIANVDYDSFEIVNADIGFAKDKNTFYINDVALNIAPNVNQKVSIDKTNIRIASGDSLLVIRTGVAKLDKYYNYKPFGELIYQKNGSTFLFDGEELKHIKKPIFDAASLTHIAGQLYQDSKNIYRIYGDEVLIIENEQVVKKHVFKKIKQPNDELTLFIGHKNFYAANDKLFNYQLRDYYFIAGSNFYVYNSALYFMDGFDYNPIGILDKSSLAFNEFEAGLNDPRTEKVDGAKARALSIDILVYDNKKLFIRGEEIKIPIDINLANLKYAGNLPLALEEATDLSGDIFTHNNEFYSLQNNSLQQVKNKALSSFKRLNAFYYTYKNTLFADENYHEADAKLTASQIDFSKLKTFNQYFTDGTNLWYQYKKTDQTVNEIKISPSPKLRALATPQTIITLNLDIPKIAFTKLQEIENTEFITDGVYLLFRGNVIGKVDLKTVKVLGNNYVADATHYFYTHYCISKKALKAQK